MALRHGANAGTCEKVCVVKVPEGIASLSILAVLRVF